jgi:hypothetical protein
MVRFPFDDSAAPAADCRWYTSDGRPYATSDDEQYIVDDATGPCASGGLPAS